MVELRVPRCCLLAKSPPVECCWRGRGRMTVLPERRAVIAWAPVRGWSGVCSARRLTASAALRQRRQRIGRELRGLGSCETTCSTDAAVPLLRGLRPLPLQPLGWMDGWMDGRAGPPSAPRRQHIHRRSRLPGMRLPESQRRASEGLRVSSDHAAPSHDGRRVSNVLLEAMAWAQLLQHTLVFHCGSSAHESSPSPSAAVSY
jgi:hypothetical protein